LLEDERHARCTPSTSTLLSECQTRIPFALWKDRYRILRALVQTGGIADEGDEDVPCVVEFSPMFKPAIDPCLRERVFVKVWKPSSEALRQLKKPLQYALAECLTLNRRSLQMKSPKIQYKRRRTQENVREGSTIAFGSTASVGPNIERLFDRSDQPLEIKYYDVWGRRDFFTVCMLNSASDGDRGLRRSLRTSVAI
jgi:hypothetical protein